MADAGYLLTVRVFYRKLGRMKYISHLDMNRCIARVLKRSGLPVWHTLGFNPHIYTTFALPLPLGFESTCESLDFRLTRELPMQEICDRLNAVLPEGLAVYRAQPAVNKPEVICWADYEITQEFDQGDAAQIARRFAKFCAKDVIEITKKGKKGERQMDIKPHFSIREVKADGNTLSFTLRAAAGSTLNINPMLLLDAFAAESGLKADWLRIVRTAILDQDFQEFS